MISTTIEQTIEQAQAVMVSLPEFNRQNAYVYYNQATKRHGFYFAPDDATAEKYAQRCGRAEQTNWLIKAVVPAAYSVARVCHECRANFEAGDQHDELCPRCQREYLRENCSGTPTD